MASTSLSTLSSSGTSSSPQAKASKKTFSSNKRSSEQQSDGGTRSSIDSLTLEKTSTLQSTKSSPSRDGSNKSGSGVRKLIPGHAKRQRKKLRDDEFKAAAASLESERGRSVEAIPAPTSAAANRSNTSLLTDTDVETPPPLVSRDSHSGYFTTSSPLISSKTFNGHRSREMDDLTNEPGTPTAEFPSIVEPDDIPPEKPTPKLTSTPVLPAPGLVDRADTLQVESGDERRNSISRLRGKSPARKVRDMFVRSGRSPRSSPERGPLTSPNLNGPAPTDPEGINVATALAAGKRPSAIETNIPLPRTPPSTLVETPLTTVTPPTPTERLKETVPPSGSETRPYADNSGIIVSPSGDMISHRRVRSASSATHSKSKLSTSMIAPLTPAIEELNSPGGVKNAGPRNVTPGGGFFSSWVSAAQNAASTLTNLTNQNRTRSGTANSDPVTSKETEANQTETDTNESTEHKQLAIETLGSGDLNFSHLGLENGANEKSRPSLASSRKNSDLTKDEQQAKIEDMLAKRAVSAAYEKINDVTPVAEIPDPIASLKHAQTMETLSSAGVSTTPNGSIFEAETGPVKRSNSVRSRLAKRRSRGSSIATGHSALGGLIGASTATLTGPAAVPKPSAFTLAPKSRNRGYHQQFRSVPEDDSLIEDYSCALQKEILLAGRIYISEGHICFSSNILGWVTTLIISFEEIVSVERENTAMIIPNAIAIQTLHARHTFRSLLSREATFDLMINIWKANHPASFQKSVNGKQLVAQQTKDVVASTVAPNDDATSQVSDDDESVNDSDVDEEDEDEQEDSAPSIMGSSASLAGSEMLDTKSIVRKASAANGGPLPTISQNGANNQSTAPTASVLGASVDYPGPVSHAPTECTDATTHYDKIIKDEIIQAPLGKIYSLLYGPQSGAWVRKYLVDECKCTDLALEDDKKGLTNENKTRQYSYTKPLSAPIGPKSTKCITSESLDFFDLEKAVSVTCTTQTPNVPSGSSFSTKTRYCLTWAPGNATRLQMNCTIEWTAKSWLKGAIESGANEGQQQYGDGLVKALKTTLGRARATTIGSKSIKNKKKKKGEKQIKSAKVDEQSDAAKTWGIFDPVRPSLEPIVSIMKPVARMDVVVTILAVMVLTLWFGKSHQRGDLRISGPFSSHAERLVAYEELWHKQESELWDWLESRAGVDKVMLGNRVTHNRDLNNHRKQQATLRRQQAELRRQQLKGDDTVGRMRAEKWTEKEMQDAVRATREKLDLMEQVLDKEIRKRDVDETI